MTNLKKDEGGETSQGSTNTKSVEEQTNMFATG